MKKNSFRVGVFLIALYFLWHLYAKTIGIRDIKKDCRMEKSIIFNKKVKDIIQDSINHPLSKIIFSDGYVYQTPYTYGLWIGLKVGDSVVKKANTLRYIIYRHCESLRVDSFGKDEDCEKIGVKFFN